MNYFNIGVFIGALTISIIFFTTVFINLGIKTEKEELAKIKEEINEIILDIKKKEIEISSLTSPVKVLKFAKDNEYVNLNLKDIKLIIIE
ncbi:MAG TPA: hypothetical protein PLE45_02940 [Spirochaetota bacterium]|nr:hypothetical protein [Spirochaetota bacterium]HOL56649.1 hypothetical protein [Spirochaetota bacterium]HPP04202.1 hypothetical protein [Spirochaetota bacterium]